MARTIGLTFEEKPITAINNDEAVQDNTFIEDMTVPQLKKFAKDNGIDLGSAAKKDEIIQAIVNTASESEV